MIQSVKNRQTMDILRKLRSQGAPEKGGEIGTVSLDMTIPAKNKLELEGEAEMDEADDEDEGDDMTEVPPVMPVPSGPNLRPKKKRQ
jgi:hypothetical protein